MYIPTTHCDDFDLPTTPTTEDGWLSNIFKHEGGFRDFQDRYEMALRHVDVNKRRRFLLAGTLLDVIADHRNLYRAYLKLSAKGSRPGPDGITWRALKRGLNIVLKRLSRAVRDSALMRREEHVIEKRKPNGGTRCIVLQSVYDRMVDTAAAQILAEALDSTFMPTSCGFRPRRGPWLAIRKVQLLIKEGYQHFVSCDVHNAFGSVPISRLLQLVRSRLPDDRLQAFVTERLEVRLVPGLRQGSPLSPVMLNLFLDHFLDKPWTKANPASPLLRYADDLLLACRSSKSAKRGYQSLLEQLRSPGLRINECQKEAVFDVCKNGVPYLGFMISTDGKGKPIVRIASKGIERLRIALGSAHRKKRPLTQRLGSWLTYFGPAYKGENRTKIYEEIRCMFKHLGRLRELPKQTRFDEVWKLKYQRYCDKSKRVSLIS